MFAHAYVGSAVLQRAHVVLLLLQAFSLGHCFKINVSFTDGCS